MADLVRESDYYDSRYLADYYESLWTDHPDLEDVDVYWSILRPLLKSHRAADGHFTLFDVGTGTGRVLNALMQRMKNEPGLLFDVMRFIGLDKSKYMLEQARKAEDNEQNHHILWCEGTATALDRTPWLSAFSGQVNMLIFAFSGINHLHLDGEIGRFLQSAHRVLRPGGIMLVSVCLPLLDVKHQHLHNPFGKFKEVKSKRLDGIVYREWETGQYIDGDLFINSLETRVFKVGSDGVEHVVEQNRHNVPLKLLTRESFTKSLAAAGFLAVEERCTSNEAIFVITKMD